MRIGVLGGGQLGQMLALSGVKLGHSFVFIDPNPQAPAASNGKHIVAEIDNKEALASLAEEVDLVTYESENIAKDIVSCLAEKLPVYPPIIALELTQDRILEKNMCRDLGIPVANYLPVADLPALEAAIKTIGLPAILKTTRLGYDGKGQCVLRSDEDLAKASSLCQVPCILEQMIKFKRELSIIVSRSTSGEVVYYPLIENVHRENILHKSIAPAVVSNNTQLTARSIAEKILSYFNYVGTMTIEFFETADGQLLLNEIAPRVHNSGHWTIEGAVTSQFENHVRAITGMPLGATDSNGFSGMINIIGTHAPIKSIANIAGTHIHSYGKSERPKRKLGHVTVCAHDLKELEAVLEQVESCL